MDDAVNPSSFILRAVAYPYDENFLWKLILAAYSLGSCFGLFWGSWVVPGFFLGIS